MSSIFAVQSISKPGNSARIYSPWIVFVTLLGVLVALYWPSWVSMIVVWNTPTYSHSYLIPVASIWLAFDKREQLRQLTARPWWPILTCLLVIGLAWVVGHLAGVNALQHFAIVSSCALIVAFAFGPDISRVLLFPLAFLLLAVPFGEFLVPYMMTWTANVTIWMVQATGIPIYREGLSFILPSGSWRVVEECSGQRYLIALMPLALMFSHLTFSQTRTKFLFLLVSLGVAILANWLRAYLIVMTGHLSGMELATGVDHLIYGWFFFGIIVALLFLWGSRWSESPVAQDLKINALPVSSPRSNGSYPLFAALVGGLAVLSSGNIATHLLAGRGQADIALQLQLAPISSGSKVNETHGLQVPFEGSHDEIKFSVGAGEATAWVGRFRNTDPSNEMIRSTQSVTSANRDTWRHTGTSLINLPAPRFGTAQEYRFVGLKNDLIVWQLYLVNDASHGDKRMAKIQLAMQQLRGKGAATDAVLLWASYQSDPNEARQILADLALAITQALIPQPNSE